MLQKSLEGYTVNGHGHDHGHVLCPFLVPQVSLIQKDKKKAGQCGATNKNIIAHHRCLPKVLSKVFEFMALLLASF